MSKRFFRPRRRKESVLRSSNQNNASSKISIDDLNLSGRTSELLKKNNITNAAQLCSRTEKDMYKIQNLNKRILLEISSSLKKKNLAFKVDEAVAKTKANAQVRVVRRPKEKDDVEISDGLKKFFAKSDFLKNKTTDKDRQRKEATSSAKIYEVPKEPLPPESWRKVQRGGKWGFSDGIKTVIAPEYDEVFSFKEGLACVEVDEKYGFIDSSNNFVVPVQYQCALSFAEGYAVVMNDGKCGYIDAKNNLVHPFVFDAATPFEEGIARVKQENKWGFMSKDGKIRWQ